MNRQELKKIRNDLGFSQKRMAAFLNLSKNTYISYELGRRIIPNDIQNVIYDRLSRKNETSLEGRIDWLRIRLKLSDFKLVIGEVLKMKIEDFFDMEKGFYGYDNCISYGSIRVLYVVDESKYEQGVLIDMSGTACREFELYLMEQGRDWEDFFSDVFIFSEKNRNNLKLEDFLSFTRFDIALDELYKKTGNISLHDFKKGLYDGFIVLNRIRSFQAIDGMENVNGSFRGKGMTLNFGSRQSSVFIRFYQKDYEQAFLKDVSVEYIREVYGYKNRYEIELHDSRAFDTILEFSQYGESLVDIGVGILNNVFEVRCSDGSFDEDWYELLGSKAGFKFVMRPKIIDVEKTKKWVTKQVASALKLLKVVDLVYGRDEISEIIAEAYLSDNHLKMAEEICGRNNIDLGDVLEIIEKNFVEEYY